MRYRRQFPAPIISNWERCHVNKIDLTLLCSTYNCDLCYICCCAGAGHDEKNSDGYKQCDSRGVSVSFFYNNKVWFVQYLTIRR